MERENSRKQEQETRRSWLYPRLLGYAALNRNGRNQQPRYWGWLDGVYEQARRTYHLRHQDR